MGERAYTTLNSYIGECRERVCLFVTCVSLFWHTSIRIGICHASTRECPQLSRFSLSDIECEVFQVCPGCFTAAVKQFKRAKRVSPKIPLAGVTSLAEAIALVKTQLGNVLAGLGGRIRGSEWRTEAFRGLGEVESLCMRLAQSGQDTGSADCSHHEAVEIFLAATIFMRPFIVQSKRMPKRRCLYTDVTRLRGIKNVEVHFQPDFSASFESLISCEAIIMVSQVTVRK